MSKEFADRNVLVTGAASGLGCECAIEFARRGANLTLVDINVGGLEETAALCAAQGASTVICVADLSDLDACRKPVETAIEAFGRLDALCNVAGMLLYGHAAETTPAQFDKLYAINVRAPFVLFQQALPHLIETEGAVVNVASSSGVMGHAYVAAYGATKGAVIAMTKNLAIEYWKSPVRINAVAPGSMVTPMSARTQMPHGFDPELLPKGIGPREMARPEDLCDVITYLASPRNKRVHGAVYCIDQGVTA